MRDIRIVQDEDGKWQVLINFIRRGVAYQTREQAEKEKNRIIEEKIA